VQVAPLHTYIIQSQPDPLQVSEMPMHRPLGRRRRRPFKVRLEIGSSSSSGTDSPAEGRHAWTRFHSKLLQSLRREQVLPKHARVLVAVSGGQVSQPGPLLT
jgi:hypothetical protein